MKMFRAATIVAILSATVIGLHFNTQLAHATVSVTNTDNNLDDTYTLNTTFTCKTYYTYNGIDAFLASGYNPNPSCSFSSSQNSTEFVEASVNYTPWTGCSPGSGNDPMNCGGNYDAVTVSKIDGHFLGEECIYNRTYIYGDGSTSYDNSIKRGSGC